MHAEELQGGFAIAFDEIILQRAEASDLVRDVRGVGDDGRERNDQPEDQSPSQVSAKRGETQA